MKTFNLSVICRKLVLTEPVETVYRVVLTMLGLEEEVVEWGIVLHVQDCVAYERKLARCVYPCWSVSDHVASFANRHSIA